MRRRNIAPFSTNLMPRFDTIPHQGEALRVCEMLDINYNPDVHRRITRAYQIVKDSGVTLTEIKPDGMIHLDVTSQEDTSKSYRVWINDNPGGTCTCQDWHRHDMKDAAAGIPFSLYHCKHLVAAKMAYAFERCKSSEIVKTFGVEYRCTAQGVEVIKRKSKTLTWEQVKAALDNHFGKSRWFGKCYRGSPQYTVYLRRGKRLEPTRVCYQKYRDGYRFWSSKHQIWTPTFESNDAEVAA